MQDRYRREVNDRFSWRDLRSHGGKRWVRRNGTTMMAGIRNIGRSLAGFVTILGRTCHTLPDVADVRPCLGGLRQLRPAQENSEDQEKIENPTYAAP
jgi:hypothetical protein